MTYLYIYLLLGIIIQGVTVFYFKDEFVKACRGIPLGMIYVLWVIFIILWPVTFLLGLKYDKD
jgi:hypothetical protein